MTMIKQFTHLDQYEDLMKSIHRSHHSIHSIIEKLIKSKPEINHPNIISHFDQNIHPLHQEIFPDTPQKTIVDIHTLRVKMTVFWEDRVFHRTSRDLENPESSLHNNLPSLTHEN